MSLGFKGHVGNSGRLMNQLPSNQLPQWSNGGHISSGLYLQVLNIFHGKPKHFGVKVIGIESSSAQNFGSNNGRLILLANPPCKQKKNINLLIHFTLVNLVAKTQILTWGTILHDDRII